LPRGDSIVVKKLSNDDIAFCWEHVLQSDPLFRVHHVFAPKALRNQLLALHALFAMVDRALALSEESLVLAQLAWWGDELSARQRDKSAHPVIRLLRESGALALLPGNLLSSLLHQAMEHSQAHPLQNGQDLEQFCMQIGQSRISLELALDRNARKAFDPMPQCAGSGLTFLTKHALSDESASLWFLPMDLQARYQSRSNSNGLRSRSATAPLMAIRDLGNKWFDEQLHAFASAAKFSGSTSSVERHLMALALSQRLVFERALEHIEKGRGGRLQFGHWSDFIWIWREYRRLLGNREQD
jgi:hypothetical protein